MRPWLMFTLGSLILTLMAFGGYLLSRRNRHPEEDIDRSAEDTRFLYLLLWLASLCILAYIAFAFGMR
ncbi:MAG: hypothetical protein P8Y37_07345 [Anaerolineales bacterium]